LRRLALLLAAVVPAASLLVAGATASADTTLVAFTGSAVLPAGAGTVIVQAEQGHGRPDPAVLTDVTVARQAIGSGPFSVAVPRSAAITKAEVNGWVPFVIIIKSGPDVTVQDVSVPVTPAAAGGNVAAVPRTVRLARFAVFYAAPPALRARVIPPPCRWSRYGRETESVVRIGQLHLTKLRGLSLAWDYGTEADTTMSVGYSDSPDKNWTISGTYTATNSLGTDSGFTIKNMRARRFAVGQAYFQRWKKTVGCVERTYRNELDHMAGSSWMAGTGAHHSAVPPPNPYNGCLTSEDPYGNDRIPPNGHFNSDRDTAATLTAATTAYGMSFSATTGFTSYIHHDYVNDSRETVYVCGHGYMPDVPTIFNNKT
jgi:hypothetical protein